MVNVAFVGAETTCEPVWDVQKLMYYGFFSVSFGQSVISFRNDFNHVGGWKLESFLPDFSQTVDAGYRSSRCRSLASVAEDELRNNVEKVQAICNLVNEVLNVRGLKILDWH
jgi:hypothetical protein